MNAEVKTPYMEGYEAASIPPDEGQPTCPYADGDPRRDKWWEGYGDWAEDVLAEE
jgi:hypothetical protein